MSKVKTQLNHDREIKDHCSITSHLIVMKLHTLPLQPSGAHCAEAKTAGQELQPDRGEQG